LLQLSAPTDKAHPNAPKAEGAEQLALPDALRSDTVLPSQIF